MVKRGRPPYPDILTPRESEVLALLREGLTNEQIAQRLGVSRDGVKYHVSEILSKLGVATREEAAAWRAEEARPWWMSGLGLLFWPLRHFPFGAAATATVATAAVATAGGIALLAWGLAVTRGENEATGLAQTPTATTWAESTRVGPSPTTTVIGAATGATPVVTPTPADTPQPTSTLTGESLAADELIARAYEAMTQISFAADVPPEPHSPQFWHPPYSIKFGPPDLLLITGGGYGHEPYEFLVGKDFLTSYTGKRWRMFPTSPGFDRLVYDPRELLRIATDVAEEGIQELNGEPHRVVSFRLDVTKYADEYLTGGELQLMLNVPSACPRCAVPCYDCVRPIDRQRVEALGYRYHDLEGIRGLLLKGRDIQIILEIGAPSEDTIWITVQNVEELTPALEAEFREVLEAYGADPAALDTAEVHVSTNLRDYGPDLNGRDRHQVRLWIDPTTFLVSAMELSHSEGDRTETETLAFIDYGRVELPEPEPALIDAEWEYYSDEVQRRWGVLALALETYAENHDGLYPEEVSPAVLGDALESEGLEWPLNAVTGEPIKETEDQNPGDFRYRAAPDRHCYFAHLYDWEGSGMAEYAGWSVPIECPEAEAFFNLPTPPTETGPAPAGE